MLTVFHVSDLHFGRPTVPEQIESIESIIQERRFDVVAISGDLSQRAHSGEFQRAQAFIRDANKVSKTIVVPGNHDVVWWKAPLGLVDKDRPYENYRRYISEDLEPVLRVPDATFVGLNTAQGVTRHTLTWRLRDISIIGAIRRSQIDRAREEFEGSPSDAARVIVMHHNPVKGRAFRSPRTQGHTQGARRIRADRRRPRPLRTRPPGSSSLHRAHAEGHRDLDGGHGLESIAWRSPIIGERHYDSAREH